MTEYLVTDDDGVPTGFFNKDKIEEDGVKLAFELASVCDLEDEVQSVLAATLARVGVDAFGYVATNALSVMTTQILDPTLRVTDTMGVFLRPGLNRIANGENPGGEE